MPLSPGGAASCGLGPGPPRPPGPSASGVRCRPALASALRLRPASGPSRTKKVFCSVWALPGRGSGSLRRSGCGWRVLLRGPPGPAVWVPLPRLRAFAAPARGSLRSAFPVPPRQAVASPCGRALPIGAGIACRWFCLGGPPLRLRPPAGGCREKTKRVKPCLS